MLNKHISFLLCKFILVHSLSIAVIKTSKIKKAIETLNWWSTVEFYPARNLNGVSKFHAAGHLLKSSYTQNFSSLNPLKWKILDWNSYRQVCIDKSTIYHKII